jgi:hypothetical protein
LPAGLEAALPRKLTVSVVLIGGYHWQRPEAARLAQAFGRQAGSVVVPSCLYPVDLSTNSAGRDRKKRRPGNPQCPRDDDRDAYAPRYS